MLNINSARRDCEVDGKVLSGEEEIHRKIDQSFFLNAVVMISLKIGYKVRNIS